MMKSRLDAVLFPVAMFMYKSVTPVCDFRSYMETDSTITPAWARNLDA